MYRKGNRNNVLGWEEWLKIVLRYRLVIVITIKSLYVQLLSVTTLCIGFINGLSAVKKIRP